jgi:hypothetical protein
MGYNFHFLLIKEGYKLDQIVQLGICSMVLHLLGVLWIHQIARGFNSGKKHMWYEGLILGQDYVLIA